MPWSALTLALAALVAVCSFIVGEYRAGYALPACVVVALVQVVFVGWWTERAR